jgi:membrane protein YdbS with pleckstrin-like domain
MNSWKLQWAVAVVSIWAAAAGQAAADAQVPTLSGNSWIAMGILLVLVAVVALFIRGALGISSRDKSDEDEAGVGVLEGIDEDDDERKKKRR